MEVTPTPDFDTDRDPGDEDTGPALAAPRCLLRGLDNAHLEASLCFFVSCPVHGRRNVAWRQAWVAE